MTRHLAFGAAILLLILASLEFLSAHTSDNVEFWTSGFLEMPYEARPGIAYTAISQVAQWFIGSPSPTALVLSLLAFLYAVYMRLCSPQSIFALSAVVVASDAYFIHMLGNGRLLLAMALLIALYKRFSRKPTFLLFLLVLATLHIGALIIALSMEFRQRYTRMVKESHLITIILFTPILVYFVLDYLSHYVSRYEVLGGGIYRAACAILTLQIITFVRRYGKSSEVLVEVALGCALLSLATLPISNELNQRFLILSWTIMVPVVYELICFYSRLVRCD